MALSRPVRVLGALAALLFIFTIIQLFRSPVKLTTPTFGGIKDKGEDEEIWRDPNLDRKL